MNNPLVSIIIVNYNGKNHLEKCLESIMKIDYNNYEIILIDNNSTDDSVEFVKNKYSSIIIIKLDKNYGFAEPCNIGAKNAKGDYFLFLNNDTVVQTNFITEMVALLKKDSEIAICQSLLLKFDGEVDSSGDFVDLLGRAYSSSDKVTEVKKILSARGASMMVRKDSFWDLGGFDIKFFASFEDVDLGWRAWICGYKVVLVPNSVVYHSGAETVKSIFPEIQFHGVKNLLVLRLVNFEIPYAITSSVKLFFLTLMSRCFETLARKKSKPVPPLPSIGITITGVIWVLKNLKYVLRKRRKVNLRRVRSTQDLMEMGLITK